MRSRLLRRTTFDLKMSVVAALLLLPAAGWAAPRRIDCKLTTIESTADPNFVAVEARSSAVIVDREAKTVAVSQDGVMQPLDHVTFTQLTINGYTNTLSLGIDTSAGNLVLQSYGPDANKIEFGTCSPK